MVLMGLFLVGTQALAQQKSVTGRVLSDGGAPIAGAQVIVKGTRFGGMTNADGLYSVRVEVGQVLQFRYIGTAPEERTVGAESVINVTLRKVATGLDAIVVSALGQTSVKRSLGSAQQSVAGAEIAQTNRENFINALAGRVAGVEVTSSSGVPGSSTVITIRGISSISTNNQPLMIIDGLPMDNKTLNTGVLASDNPTSGIAFSNRGLDFTNRASDINPEDIESLVVLKGPEASALYGIDAGNGAIVITTKRGRPGTGGFEYSNSFRLDRAGEYPSLQRKYSTTSSLSQSTTDFTYWGLPYAAGTKFYDTVVLDMGMKHNWKTSGDLDLMYRGTYSPAFYRALHRATHKAFRMWESLRMWRHPLRSLHASAKRLLALPWYAATLAVLPTVIAVILSAHPASRGTPTPPRSSPARNSSFETVSDAVPLR